MLKKSIIINIIISICSAEASLANLIMKYFDKKDTN